MTFDFRENLSYWNEIFGDFLVLEFKIEKVEIVARPRKLSGNWKIEIMPTEVLLSDEVLEMLEEGSLQETLTILSKE